jgi:hypothetical protein
MSRKRGTFSKRFYVIGRVVGGGIHTGRDVMGLHLSFRIRAKEGEKTIFVMDGRVEPLVFILFGHDDGHTVMDRPQEIVGLRRDDRAASDLMTFRRMPGLVKAGKAEGFLRLHADIDWGPPLPLPPPLIKAVGYDETPSLIEGGAEAGFLGHCLGPGIDHAVSDCGIVGPGGNETPMETGKTLCSFFGQDDKDILAGCDVVAGLEIAVAVTDAELLRDECERTDQNKTPAHGICSF